MRGRANDDGQVQGSRWRRTCTGARYTIDVGVDLHLDFSSDAAAGGSQDTLRAARRQWLRERASKEVSGTAPDTDTVRRLLDCIGIGSAPT